MARGQIWQKFPKLLRFMALFPSLIFAFPRILFSHSVDVHFHHEHTLRIINETWSSGVFMIRVRFVCGGAVGRIHHTVLQGAATFLSTATP